ncbi:MAG: CDP-glucose 4,6-dehydratase [Acidobacteriota bacterium]|nr:CDP-glucose 4,6-dehydratase [Acidobacteriota bacterium]
MNRDFWRGRRVFLTGHTGFKGSWLTQWLTLDGAHVTGYALPPPSDPSLFADARLAEHMESISGDVRDLDSLSAALQSARPEIVVHMAGQALVRGSYNEPVGTYATNVMGTVNVLEAIRRTPTVRVALMVTSDKCYENSTAHAGRPFREDDPLGGRDPYASSKACAELVTTAYRSSFFAAPQQQSPRIASVRAGNVIGGGDWATDRLIPDLVRAFREERPALIRNPAATRPWQFVLDALHGYRKAIESLYGRDDLPHAWNFGADEARPVRWLADAMVRRWGGSAAWHTEDGDHPHEAPTLALDSSLAKETLQWKPLIDSETTIQWTTDWYKRRLAHESAAGLMSEQIARFEERA